MVLSLLVILVPLAIIIALFSHDPAPDEDQKYQVNWQQAVDQAVAANKFEVQTLSAVPADWSPTKARWLQPGEAISGDLKAAGFTLELGFVIDKNLFVGIDQTVAPLRPYLKFVGREPLEDGTIAVNGQTWQRYRSTDGRTTSLVSTLKGRNTIVVGDTDAEHLAQVATMLVPAKQG